MEAKDYSGEKIGCYRWREVQTVKYRRKLSLFPRGTERISKLDDVMKNFYFRK